MGAWHGKARAQSVCWPARAIKKPYWPFMKLYRLAGGSLVYEQLWTTTVAAKLTAGVGTTAANFMCTHGLEVSAKLTSLL
jgi:hypothetical protein